MAQLRCGQRQHQVLAAGPDHRQHFDQLRIAWSWDTADVRILAAHRNDARLRGAGFKATPLMVGGVLFVSTGLGQIAALDATTGRTRWVYDPESLQVAARQRDRIPEASPLV